MKFGDLVLRSLTLRKLENEMKNILFENSSSLISKIDK